MKRLLEILLVSIFCLGSVGFAADTQNFAISRHIDAISSAGYSPGSSEMLARVNKLGYATINNNTLDGWQLTAQSANAGQFMNTSTGNGEEPLNYNLDITKISGTRGDGITLANSLDLGASASFICDLESGSNQNSATVNLKLGFEVDFHTQGTRFEMAGSYADTLTITYVDI